MIFFSYRYNRGGEKQVIVTAKNNISGPPNTVSFTVKAKSEIGEISIQLRPAATIDGVLKIPTKQKFDITVSTASKQPVNYTFQFSEEFTSDPVVTTDGSDAKETYIYDKETDYKVTITANVSGYSEKRFVHVIAKTCGSPALYFPSQYSEDDPQVITRASSVNFIVQKNQPDCSRGELQYHWKIYPETPSFPVPASSDPSLMIQEGRLEAGNYSVILNISYNDSTSQELDRYFFQTYIRVEKSDLVAVISGGSFREVDSNISDPLKLKLDASASEDPDSSEQSLNFKWECKFEDNSPCSSVSFDPDQSSPVVRCLFKQFRENVTYIFKVTVSKDSRSVSATQNIKLLAHIPSLEIR